MKSKEIKEPITIIRHWRIFPLLLERRREFINLTSVPIYNIVPPYVKASIEIGLK